MRYRRYKVDRFFQQINSEAKAQEFLWRVKFEGLPFRCPQCKSRKFFSLKSRPEVKKCKSCHQHVRLRAGTIFESSKKGLLLWLKAIYFVTQGKRGISAVELKRHLGLSSYQTAWAMLHKIREALKQRDDRYHLKGTVEVDGAVFGRARRRNQVKVLMAVEAKDWIDERGRPRAKAGFAKALVGKENKEDTTLLAEAMRGGSIIRSDGSPALKYMPGMLSDYRRIPRSRYKYRKAQEERLGWVNRLISNTKAWLQGTHHGIGKKYLQPYISEYLYRFNRRHDPDGLFHRAVNACAVAEPKTYGALFG
jgi:transposase-like protein